MIVENQSNIKVHFAGCENTPQFKMILSTNVKYTLYTCFPFVERMVFEKGKFPIMPCDIESNLIPNYITSNSKHTIQDSGLFTLMFGAGKDIKITEQLIEKWYSKLVEFTLQNNNGATCVEVDCQKILGVEKAWEFRERLKKDIPNRIINVFHKEDGQKGLDRLIEFSDYIAISVPELRFLGQKNSTIQIANYIKNKKPSIDIHLLGCTELKLLKELSFCSSSDSTTWTAPKRYGFIKGNRIGNIKEDEVLKMNGIDKEKYFNARKYNNETNTAGTVFFINFLLNEYNKYAGSQD